MRVLICGGGVIGAACAYFLSLRGANVVLIERCAVACGASGKSGGFLAHDWCDGTPLQSLARRSFDLHATLADELGHSWGYRRLDTYAGKVSPRPGRATTMSSTHAWLSGNVHIRGRIGSTDTTAQVDPAEFTAALMRAAIEAGTKLHLGTVTGLVWDRSRYIRGVATGAGIIEGDAVVIAMGPWSQLAGEWLSLPSVYGLKGHSLVFRTNCAVPPQALFLECEEADGAVSSPEVFPRSDGTTYVCAISSETPVPLDPAAVIPDPGAMDRLQTICAGISPILAESPILAKQACFRPLTGDGLPIIGPVPNVEGAYVATGHSVWGILNGPATGEALSELILDGATTHVELSPFDPGRFG